ncbi:hypothetical protein EZV62_010915 [Acer yangbiense]|uniref:Uncharacterized protein n=1 Tax=Acer yangbiense TaxID=1000413 RepID=A0A5C7I3V1_9ROSI|nr:hypothetical protein EZV62_010915 [Acer yangbiense]
MVLGSRICAKMVVVDTRHHMLCRLASIITKELLNGQKVVMRMILHKTKREAVALARFKAYVGVPPPYDKMKIMVIPDAITIYQDLFYITN